MVNDVKPWYWSCSRTFVLELPHIWEEDISIDKKKGQTIGGARLKRKCQQRALPSNFSMTCQLDKMRSTAIFFFDVKMDFNCKARYVAGVHLIDPPYYVPTYASFVSRELVRILFLIASLYNIEFLAADISNAFLNTQITEKNCFKAGPNLRVARACGWSSCVPYMASRAPERCFGCIWPKRYGQWDLNQHFSTAMCGCTRTFFLYHKNSMILWAVG